MSIDFKKAFDSVKREKIIEVMEEYKVHPQLIEGVANIYVGDKTTIDLGGGLEQEVGVTSGIRQGCTGSATIFKLITYKMDSAYNLRTRLKDSFIFFSFFLSYLFLKNDKTDNIFH